jgi:hypothetical protein
MAEIMTPEAAVAKAHSDWGNRAAVHLAFGSIGATGPSYLKGNVFYSSSVGCSHSSATAEYVKAYNDTIATLLMTHGIPTWSAVRRYLDGEQSIQLFLSSARPIALYTPESHEEEGLAGFVRLWWPRGYNATHWLRDSENQLLLLAGFLPEGIVRVDLLDLFAHRWMASHRLNITSLQERTKNALQKIALLSGSMRTTT